MRRFVVFILLAWGYGFGAVAQNTQSLLDTIRLNEVVTYGNLRKYQSGAKIETISSASFDLGNNGNLGQLLSRNLPVPIKTDAGGLSTIHFRGTGASHTSFNFGGININSLTLGQTNVSSVPVYLFDEMGVQFGSASSVNGSGSIGGAIHLGLHHNWTEGFRAEARIANGSFGEQLYGTKLFAGNGKFESVTRAFYYYKTNNFPFTNPNERDFENGIFEVEDVQQNASLENMGLLQEFNYRFEPLKYIAVRAWLQKDWRLAQQNMQSNLSQPEIRETYENENIRIWADFKNRKAPFKYEISGGYVFDNAVSNQNTDDTIQTQRVISEAKIEHDFRKNASYKIGAKATRIFPNVHTYSKQLDHEDRIDFYASYYHRFFNKLTATVNLRQGFVTDFKVPFTPSVGLNFLAISKEKYVLNFSGNIARSYRVPTFNDRFWLPGGNPDLKPEKGMNYELGSKFSFCSNEVSGNISVNAFLLNIDNWILWKNGGSFWYADNVQKVESKGLEVMTDWTFQLWIFENTSGVNYAYTSTIRLKSRNNTNALGRQMEYVPKHSGTFFNTSSYKKIDFTIDGSYTGEQFTNEEKINILDAYFLLNVAGAYHFNINKKHSIKINGMVNNLLNKNYQATYGYAMPGINYHLSLTYNFK